MSSPESTVTRFPKKQVSRARYCTLIIAEAICLGIDPNLALSKSHLPEAVLVRFSVWRILKDGGIGPMAIARAARCHHSTVIQGLNRIAARHEWLEERALRSLGRQRKIPTHAPIFAVAAEQKAVLA